MSDLKTIKKALQTASNAYVPSVTTYETHLGPTKVQPTLVRLSPGGFPDMEVRGSSKGGWVEEPWDGTLGHIKDMANWVDQAAMGSVTHGPRESVVGVVTLVREETAEWGEEVGDSVTLVVHPILADLYKNYEGVVGRIWKKRRRK